MSSGYLVCAHATPPKLPRLRKSAM